MSETHLTPLHVSILTEIAEERSYQIGKWGLEVDDELNTPWMWTSYVVQYASSWMSGLFFFPQSTTDSFRKAMVKVATLAFAAIESIDRQRANNGSTFYEQPDPQHGGDFASA